MYANNIRINGDGKIDAVPNSDPLPHITTSAAPYDSHVDIAAEARLWNERMARFERESNDPTNSPQGRDIAKMNLDAMKKATPLQVAQWRALAEARAKRGGR